MAVESFAYPAAVASFILENKNYPAVDKIAIAGCLAILPLSKIITKFGNPSNIDTVLSPAIGTMTGLAIGATAFRDKKIEKELLKKISNKYSKLETSLKSLASLMSLLLGEEVAATALYLRGNYSPELIGTQYVASHSLTKFVGWFFGGVALGLTISFIAYYKKFKDKFKSIVEAAKNWAGKIVNVGKEVYKEFFKSLALVGILVLGASFSTKLKKKYSVKYSEIMNRSQRLNEFLRYFKTAAMFSGGRVIKKTKNFVVENASSVDTSDYRITKCLNAVDLLQSKLSESIQVNVKITDAVSHSSISNILMGGNVIFCDVVSAENLSEEELAAVMAHEFGHIKHKDTASSAFAILWGALFSMIVSKRTTMFAIIGATSVLLYHIGAIAELKADSFSVKLGFAGYLASALQKLACKKEVQWLTVKYKCETTLKQVADVHGSIQVRIKRLEELGKSQKL